MYAGQVVEQSKGTGLIDGPTHPYTQLLIASVPDPADPTRTTPEMGDHTTQVSIAQQGCRFSPRCPHAMDVCRTSEPPMFDVGDGHVSKCWLHAKSGEIVDVGLPDTQRGGTITKK
jgi:peptide/nickel transport system ATP-binding protein